MKYTKYLLLCAVLFTAGVYVYSADAAGIIAESGLKGGVIVHVGCKEGTLTDALGQVGGFTVQGIDSDAESIGKARSLFRSSGNYGLLSFDIFNGTVLPYIDNMINLLIVTEGAYKGTEEELMRVLVPGGTLLMLSEKGDITEKKQKKRPDALDEWTHYLHGPDNNAVSRDTVVAPPRRLQWECGPKWARHHDHMSSTSAMVSSGGRVFYIFDEGLTANIYTPSHWALISRDAFNGKLLWKRKINNWYTRFKGLKDGPADAPRRLIAADGRLYVTLTLRGAVTCLNAETGETVREYPETKEAEEILYSNGILYVLCGPGSIGDGGRVQRPVEKRTLIAVNAQTGEKLWSVTDIVAALTPAVGGGNLYYLNFESKQVIALNCESGERKWTSEKVPVPKAQKSFFASKLVFSDGIVLLAGGEYSGMIKSTGGADKNDTLTAFDAATGKTLWKAEHLPSGYSSPEDLFVIDGQVWFGNNSNGKSDGTQVALDLKTGEEKERFAADKKNYWFHHRCYSGRATVNYVMTSRTGIEFIDLKTHKYDLNHWARGACLYGILPANGLIYTPPAPCICYAETYLHSFNAYAPAGAELKPDPVTSRLEKGPAYGKPGDVSKGTPDWPTYRGDNTRSGCTSASGPVKPVSDWQVELEGKLSALTSADGKVFVSRVDTHTLYALDCESEKTAWQFTAGGRIDSPPSYENGFLYFGANDGYVYSLRASDGALAWRFRAAPVDRRILSYEQIESLWPVHGSVMIQNGMVHFVAGRSAFVDGGLRFYRLKSADGELVSETGIDNRDPATGEDLQTLVKWLNMPVARPDILSSDGKRMYMRSQAFDLEGKRLRVGPVKTGPEEGKFQGGEETHLFCPTGYLDDTWFHRTYWVFASIWGSGWNGYYINGKFAPAGRIMCVDGDRVYSFGRQPRYYKWTSPLEYRLFASKKVWERAPQAKKADQTKNTGKKKRRRQEPGPVINPGNYFWKNENLPILVRAMVLAGEGENKTLFIAGLPDVLDTSKLRKSLPKDKQADAEKQEQAYLGKSGGLLWAVSASDGTKKTEVKLSAPPVWDGMIAADGKLFIALMDGTVVCLK